MKCIEKLHQELAVRRAAMPLPTVRPYPSVELADQRVSLTAAATAAYFSPNGASNPQKQPLTINTKPKSKWWNCCISSGNADSAPKPASLNNTIATKK